MGSHAFLQGVFPTQASNSRLLCPVLTEFLPLGPPGKAQHWTSNPRNDGCAKEVAGRAVGLGHLQSLLLGLSGCRSI